MNMIVKSAVAGVLALGAGSAFALGIPNSGSSDLILVVENTTTQATYAFDTGISLDSVLPTTSLVTGSFLSTAIPGVTTAGTSPTSLSTFLAANPAAGDAWSIEGGQGPAGAANAGNAHAPGAVKAIFTSALGTMNNANLSGKILTPLINYENGLNADINTGGLLNGLTTATVVTGTGLYPSGTGSASTKYGLLGAADYSTLGSTPVQLFGLTGNNTTSTLQSYILGTVTLDASGVLTFTGNGTAPVPLPAAVWLFGSGLMGLVGVSRRRKAAVQA
jgi:hypothetical protein